MLALAAAVPPLTWVRVFTAWRAEPGVLAAAALLGGGYAWGLRRRGARTDATGRAAPTEHRPGEPATPVAAPEDQPSLEAWPVARTVAFFAGVATILLVGCSVVGVYDDTYFWARATQNTVLLMITPMLLALGAPIRLAADTLPPRWRAPLSRALHGPIPRALTFPLVITVVLVLPLLVLYLSPLYELTLRSAVASGAAGAAVTAAGFTYYWSRFRIDPTPREGSYLVTLWVTIVEMIGDAVLGVVLWLGPLVAAGWYAAQATGIDPRLDQTIGAGVLWVGGDVIGLPFILIVVNRLSREDEGRARVVDAEMDAEEERTGQLARPWWENDPQLADRFRPRP